MKNHRTKTNTVRRIPPPPNLEAGYDAIIEYHSKYSMEELEEAGYLEEVPRKQHEELVASATNQFLCKNGLRLKLSRKDYEHLSLLAARSDLAPENIVKGWIKQRLRELSQSGQRESSLSGLPTMTVRRKS